MMNVTFKSCVIYVIISLVVCNPVFGKGITLPELQTINLELKKNTDALIKRHSSFQLRPSSCPLESNRNQDILTKIETIKALFVDNCLDTDKNLIDEILNGSKEIQSEIDEAFNSSTDGTSEEISTPLEINGVKMAEVLSSINSIYKSKSCKGLIHNQSFLQKTSDIITDFTKLGLLVPNQYALYVAGGGLVVSALFKMLDSIFSNRFNFENISDRQVFIKLNCAFYDLRRDIQKSGITDVSTDSHREDITLVKDTVKLVKESNKLLQESYNKIQKEIVEDQAEYFRLKMGKSFSLFESIRKNLELINVTVTNNREKMHVINDLSLNYNDLNSQLRAYIKSGVNKVTTLDYLLLKEIKKLDYRKNRTQFSKLINLGPKDFEQEYLDILRFHFERITIELEAFKVKKLKEWSNVTFVGELNFKTYIKEFEQGYDKLKKESIQRLSQITEVSKRLSRILKDDKFSSLDDGSENTVNILEGQAIIADKIYGSYGYKFLKYTTSKSIKENKVFMKKFQVFAKRYLEKEEGDYQVPPGSAYSSLGLRYACQDAAPFKRIWKFANGLAQQGYDFVAANGDLFHDDIPRIFLGKTGGRRFGIHNFKNKYERIQYHYKSALFAKKVINGDRVEKKTRKKYLKKKYLGKAMLNSFGTKKYAEVLQDFVEKYDCNKILAL